MMDDDKLEKLAVKEILREAEALAAQNTTNNVLSKNYIKPNKLFLGRTLSSILTHNKRTNERTQNNCRNKLKELEHRRRRRLRREYYDRKRKQQVTNESDYKCVEVYSSSSSTDSDLDPWQIISAKKSRQRYCQRNYSSNIDETKELETPSLQYEREEYYAKHFHQLAAYALASKSYNQVGKWLCYQTLLAGSAELNDMTALPCDNFDVQQMKIENPLSSLSSNKAESPVSLSSEYENDLQQEIASEVEEEAIKSEMANYCICLDSDTDEQSDAAPEILQNALECQLIDDELAELKDNDDKRCLTTVEVQDSSDNEAAAHADSTIDLTSD